jgi:orotidine-5'-phosphate decarboxylase
MSMERNKQLIVALDGDWDLDGVSHIAGLLAGEVGMAKIGKRLFTRFGPEVVRRVRNTGLPVFLDLKFHDIPNTVATAVGEAVHLGVSMLTLHAAGGREMLKRAKAGALEEAGRLGVLPPSIVAVTVLTSLDDASLSEVGVSGGVSAQVERLSRLAYECDLDGVVASPMEIGLIRKVCGHDFLLVTPGIRPSGKVAGDDQSRVLTPAAAIKEGVDYIVVGRPIYGASDPVEAARQIVAEMETV